MTDLYPPTIEELSPAITPEDHARAIFNLLEDFAGEKDRLKETQKAFLNILEDFAGEKGRLEETQRAIFNILEDFAEEKDRLEETQRAVFNILDDFSNEKARLEEAQRAMLNLLDDFDVERTKAEAANRELSANEERLQITLGEKENLLKEIHHRVKNNLQIIHSMLNLQMSYVRDEKAIELFKESKNRVYSMALIHERLYQSESLAKIDLPEYIRSLTTNLFLSYGVSERIIQPTIDVENVPLDIDRLIPFALIVTELISNSLKHAFPELPGRAGVEGEILVELRRGFGNKLLLTVRDNGIGMPDGLKLLNSGSLGLKLVSVLVRQLRGEIELESGRPGTEFRIIFEGLRESR
jgi:two-component sensor histidine kinase